MKAKRNWSLLILNDLQERGESSVYSLASSLGTQPGYLYQHVRALLDAGRIKSLTSNEFQGDGSPRVIYFLPEQYERWRVNRRVENAVMTVRACREDAVLLDVLIEHLVQLPGFEPTLALHRRT